MLTNGSKSVDISDDEQKSGSSAEKATRKARQISLDSRVAREVQNLWRKQGTPIRALFIIYIVMSFMRLPYWRRMLLLNPFFIDKVKIFPLLVETSVIGSAVDIFHGLRF